MSNRVVRAPRRPESVLVVVYTSDAETLLLKRSAPFAFWQSVTGSLEAGESAADAAKRELLEETGISTAGTLIDTGRSRTFTIDPRWRGRYAADVSKNVEYEWHYRLTDPVAVLLDAAEHSTSQWVSIEDALDEVWSWTNKEALQLLQAELRSNVQKV